MKNLSEEEFQQTFSEKMIRIDFDTNLLEIDLILSDFTLLEPERAYRNGTNTYEHHIMKTNIENVMLVYVKDLQNQDIAYHVLDLNEKYGIK